MQKPYHIVGTDSDGNEVVRFTAMPPVAAGPAEDGKGAKDKDGNYIRVFTITESTSEDYIVGSKLTMTHIPGEFPYMIDEDIRLTCAPIDGVRAKKPRKAKTEKQVVAKTEEVKELAQEEA
jgi:hypothetical protein